MSRTKYDNLDARGATAPVRSTFPDTPEEYYGTQAGRDAIDWTGGELFYHSGQARLYMNSATSGRTATWRRLADAFVTSTTTSTSTTSTSTSSTSSSSTSTTTSSTTSTSTSSSSSTSTSTSTSSTTTA